MGMISFIEENKRALEAAAAARGEAEPESEVPAGGAAQVLAEGVVPGLTAELLAKLTEAGYGTAEALAKVKHGALIRVVPMALSGALRGWAKTVTGAK